MLKYSRSDRNSKLILYLRRYALGGLSLLLATPIWFGAKEIDANRLMWDFFQKHRLRSEAMVSDNEALKVFDFSREGASPWRSIDDSVMGGVSESDMKIVEGAARFSGSLSLKNNGGFASVRSDAQEFNLNGREGLRIHVRGDGRKYQLRLRSTTAFDGPSYTASFATEAGKWIETDLPFNSFRATYRGRDLPEYPELDPSSIRTFGILLGDKQEGDFELDISSISAYSQ